MVGRLIEQQHVARREAECRQRRVKGGEPYK